jgi:hypothetical protein
MVVRTAKWPLVMGLVVFHRSNDTWCVCRLMSKTRLPRGSLKKVVCGRLMHPLQGDLASLACANRGNNRCDFRSRMRHRKQTRNPEDSPPCILRNLAIVAICRLTECTDIDVVGNDANRSVGESEDHNATRMASGKTANPQWSAAISPPKATYQKTGTRHFVFFDKTKIVELGIDVIGELIANLVERIGGAGTPWGG